MPHSRPESESSHARHRQYRFANFLLDISRGALFQDGKEIPLRRQAYDMLVLLVEHQGELVDKDFLMNAIWHESVVTENSITQCLKEIRRAIGDDELSMVRTVPRRGYIFEVPVEIIADFQENRSGIGKSRNIWFAATVAALVITAAAWWMLQFQQPVAVATTATPDSKSVAVLPFINMSPDPEVAFLADGISEEILNELAQIPDLLVIARTSSFAFKDQDVDIAEIGQQLNVAHVLEGSVRVEGSIARVTAQLVNTENQAHIWSQTYDRSRDGIFDLQTSIAQDVAQQLHARFTDMHEDSTKGTYKPTTEAYEAFLRGKSLLARRTPETITGAVNEFSKAVEIDPGFAAAHANLALSIRFQSDTQYGDLPKNEAIARARPHAERAFDLNPELAEANAAMAYVLVSPETMKQALYYFRRAVSLNPNYADGSLWLGSFLSLEGQYEESFELIRRAVRADPLSVAALSQYAVSLLERGRIEEAGLTIDKLASLAPDIHRELEVDFQAHKGQWAQGALGALQSKLEAPESFAVDGGFAVALAAMGLGENVLAMTHVEHPLIDTLLGRPQATVNRYQQLQSERGLNGLQEWILGEALAATGDYTLALPYLEDNRAYADGRVFLPLFGADSVLALIAARSATGKETDSETLIRALTTSLERYRNAGYVLCDPTACVDYEEGVAAYLSGDFQAAREHLIRAVSNGYLIPSNRAYLQRLYDDPELAAVFERQDAHARAQRLEFLNAICTENPYADVWQPEEGTCDENSGDLTKN